MKNQYINEIVQTLEKTEVWKYENEKCADYDEGIFLLSKTFVAHRENGSRLFFIGNGGSAAIAGHMTADFMKNGGMNAVSLYDDAVITCMGNDYGYEFIFSRQLEFLGNKNDMLVAISSSGNSPDILNAARVSKEREMDIVTFTGFKDDNRLKAMGDINVYVPSERYGIVESIHNMMLQQIVDTIMESGQ